MWLGLEDERERLEGIKVWVVLGESVNEFSGEPWVVPTR